MNATPHSNFIISYSVLIGMPFYVGLSCIVPCRWIQLLMATLSCLIQCYLECPSIWVTLVLCHIDEFNSSWQLYHVLFPFRHFINKGEIWRVALCFGIKLHIDKVTLHAFCWDGIPKFDLKIPSGRYIKTIKIEKIIARTQKSNLVQSTKYDYIHGVIMRMIHYERKKKL